MRLLHVFSTFAIGGPQARFAQLVRLLPDGIEHAVMALDGRTNAAQLLPANARVTLVAAPSARGPQRFVRSAAALGRARPDVLLTYNWGAIEWAMVNRIWPRCGHLHCEDGFGPDEAGGRQIPRRVLFRRLALGGSSRVLMPSWTLYRIATEIWRLPPARLDLVPNGVDLARFARRAGPDELKLPNGAGPLVVSVGALRPEKSYTRLIDAVAGIAGLRLAIIGEGPERPKLEAAIAGHGAGARIVLPGASAAPEHWLAHADLFALSSITEQMPISLVEAMAAGLPVVATDVGDIARMVAAANRAAIVPLAAAADYRAALAGLAADPAARAVIGAANRQRAEAVYDERLMAARWHELLQRIARRPADRFGG